MWASPSCLLPAWLSQCPLTLSPGHCPQLTCPTLAPVTASALTLAPGCLLSSPWGRGFAAKQDSLQSCICPPAWSHMHLGCP